MNAAMNTAADAGADNVEPKRTRTPQWLAMVIAGFFALFFAYDVWEALGNLVGLLSIANELGLGLSGFGWAVLIAAMLLPIALFGAAFWAGFRRGPLQQLGLYLAALAVSAALYLDIYTVFGPVTLFG